MKALLRIKNVLMAQAKPTSPTKTFDKELAARTKRYAELRKLVAEVLYLEARQGGEIHERRAELARLHHRALVAGRKGEDGEVRRLEHAQRATREALAEAEAELDEIRSTAADARDLLHTAGTTLSALASEARLAARTESLHRMQRRLAWPEDQGSALDEARLQLERMRAERAIDAELRALPAPR